jgi:ribosomal protein L29
MSTFSSTKELRGMNSADLQREVSAQKNLIAKLQLHIAGGKEKNTAKLRIERKKLAQLSTVLTEKTQEHLQKSAASTTVSSPSQK